MRRIALFALVITSTIAFCLPPEDLCAKISTVSDAKLSVSISGSRTSFREGEIIPLLLSFTSTADKRYWADNRNYDRSGRLSIETYCIEPAARDPLADYFRTGMFMGGGLGSEQQLSKAPFTATAELNEWRQPTPGRYRLHVISSRIWRPPDPGEKTPYGRLSMTLRSNTIEFEVVKANPDWQAKQLQDALLAYHNAASGKEKESARRLRFLNTRESVETLATLFWGLNDQPGGWDLMFGLFGSPYRAQAIAAVQREIHAPEHPITQDFLRTLTKLQINSDTSWDPPAYDPAQIEVAQEYWRRRQIHERELMEAAVKVTATALPRKVGRARAQTLRALVESSELLPAATARAMRKELVSVWGDLPENTKLELIQYRWSAIAGPEMLPILKEFVSRPAPPFRTTESMARDAALEHVYELNPAEGRALIARDIRDPKANPSLNLLKLLSASDLGPTVQDAGTRLEKNEARDLDYHLVEFYADATPLPMLKQLFNQHLGTWGCEPQDALLRYFLNWDLEFGIKAVEASLAARKDTGCYQMLLQDMGKQLPKVQQVAIRALDDEDLQVANDAALALGRWANADAEAALWARLKRFREQWKDRENELRVTPDYQSPIARATALESTLVKSIASGTGWMCGPEKLERLHALASPRQQVEIEAWSRLWKENAVIAPNWYPEDHLTFGVLQYSNLEEEQLRSKLSQMPKGTKLYFQIWKPGQISPPVSLEQQQTTFQGLEKYASQFGVAIEQKSD